MSTEAARMEYKRRKDAGLCIACPKGDIKPHATGVLMCEEHMEYHRKKGLEYFRAKQSPAKVCANCPKEFVIPATNRSQRFCCRTCANEWQKNNKMDVIRIPKSSLEKLMQNVCYENYQGMEGQFAL